MKTWVKVALVTALFAVPAMALGKVIWPPAPGGPEPSAGQFPFFILLAVFEALTFGLGISFLLFGCSPAAGCRRDVEGLGDLPERQLVLGLLVAARQPSHPQR
jgi:hypothetical protein